MMQGYWARPDLNAKAFAYEEPFPGYRKRFYRTGDLVIEREDGILMFAGRKDRQIKSRGYRVELDEVESVVGAQEDLAEAAALGVRNAEGMVEIVAVVRAHPGGSIDPAAIRSRTAERLPAYAVPVRIVELTDFPRTGSGKIDRRVLTERLEAAGDPEGARGS
jgi:acyl-coenzyme A synthetase/AMP-(fatty) acid ligase